MKTRKSKKLLTEFDFKEMEYTKMKGDLAAIKHYYAVLIAKNVSKVEEVNFKISKSIDLLTSSIEETRLELRELLELKKTKINKEKIELTQRIIQILEREKEECFTIYNLLRQVL